VKRLLWTAAALLPCIVLLAGAGCRTYEINCTVKNRTGAPIELMEFDYPSASFGLDSMANGADYSYKIQVRGSGPVSVQYNVALTHKLVKSTGPSVEENQEGTMEIVLMPNGHADFFSKLSAPQ
jgi:hypothetical protein